MVKINVLDKEVTFYTKNDEDYICITDIAKYKSQNTPADLIKNWTRRKDTIEFLGLWEKINNSNFKLVEFDQLRNQAGSNSFVLSPTKWVEKTGAIGIFTRSGKFGGTYAHKDIAFEFASWVSVEFRLYLIKEFQRLKSEENERKQLNWNFKRDLVKINYTIHTDAIKENLIPKTITRQQEKHIYANEADVLNVALFGITAKSWRNNNSDKKGNIRDYANVYQLICLSNLENLNASFIKDGLKQSERLVKLNDTAISQMRILVRTKKIKQMSNIGLL